MTEVILVDENDLPTGSIEKIEAHRKALLHRAFSIFIFNARGEMLLHQRAPGKYHSGGLWSNACCSHPAPGQETQAAAEKRLLEEMGIAVELTPAFSFIYKAPFDNGLTEHEFDHVLVGYYDGVITPDPREVSDFTYEPVEKIRQELEQQPQKFTAWFKIAFPKMLEYLAVHSGESIISF